MYQQFKLKKLILLHENCARRVRAGHLIISAKEGTFQSRRLPVCALATSHKTTEQDENFSKDRSLGEILELTRIWVMRIRKLKNFNSRISPPHCLVFTIALARPLAAVACSGMELFLADDVSV